MSGSVIDRVGTSAATHAWDVSDPGLVLKVQASRAEGAMDEEVLPT